MAVSASLVFFGLMADDTVFFSYELPADGLENRPVLCRWAEKAVAVARRSATAKGR